MKLEKPLGMNHDHVGPPERACEGCFWEIRVAEAEQTRGRFWGVLIAGFMIVLALAVMGALSWCISKYGSHLG